jgi:hypothetical protein
MYSPWTTRVCVWWSTGRLRRAHALELAREGVQLNVIQRNSDTPTSAPRASICRVPDTEEIIATVHARRAPMMSASAGLQL